MRMPRPVTILAVLASVAAVAALALQLSPAAEAQRKVTWKMASAFGSKLPHLGTSAIRFADNVKIMSGGSLELKFFEPGALVPALECFDAVSKGSVESCWTTPGYHTGKYPALAFFTTVPFGPRSASSSPGSGSAAATSSGTRSTPSTTCSRSTASRSGRRPPGGSARKSRTWPS